MSCTLRSTQTVASEESAAVLPESAAEMVLFQQLMAAFFRLCPRGRARNLTLVAYLRGEPFMPMPAGHPQLIPRSVSSPVAVAAFYKHLETGGHRPPLLQQPILRRVGYTSIEWTE